MTDNQFMIDSESLSISSDGIVRYTLVIVSPSGAQNVSYEGNQLRDRRTPDLCLGRSDRPGQRRAAISGKIVDNSLNRHHAELYTDYFCPSASPFGMPTKSAQALRRGGHPSMMRR
jgi:hypothetical protein